MSARMQRKPSNGNDNRITVSTQAVWAEIRRARNESRAMIGAVAAAGLVLLGFAWQTVTQRMDLMVEAAKSVAVDVRSVVDKTERIGRETAVTSSTVEALRGDIQRIDRAGTQQAQEDMRDHERSMHGHSEGK